MLFWRSASPESAWNASASSFRASFSVSSFSLVRPPLVLELLLDADRAAVGGEPPDECADDEADEDAKNDHLSPRTLTAAPDSTSWTTKNAGSNKPEGSLDPTSGTLNGAVGRGQEGVREKKVARCEDFLRRRRRPSRRYHHAPPWRRRAAPHHHRAPSRRRRRAGGEQSGPSLGGNGRWIADRAS